MDWVLGNVSKGKGGNMAKAKGREPATSVASRGTSQESVRNQNEQQTYKHSKANATVMLDTAMVAM